MTLLCMPLLHFVGYCAELQTVITGRSGSTSCIGDSVTYICTVPSQAHLWNVPALGANNVGISRVALPFNDGGVSIAIVPGPDAPNPIVSALTVTASPQLNGASIICADIISSADQNTTATVFGGFVHNYCNYNYAEYSR